MKKIITGVKPTGASMHLGNLLGAVLPFGRVAEGQDASLFIADLHALTSVKDAETLKAQSHELALEYFAIFGIDTKIRIYRQSDIALTPKLNWILSNVTPLSLMNRAHSFKDGINRATENALNRIDDLNNLIHQQHLINNINCTETTSTDELSEALISRIKNELIPNLIIDIFKTTENINMGVFNYPILMAADILGADADVVPVGKDQIQHLEMTRDIARAFNKTYSKEVFKEPVGHVEKSVETLPGVDGRKMSKSYNNFIGVFDDEKKLKKSIMSIVTDSKGVEEPKDPEKVGEECNVFALIKVFATTERREEIRAKYLAGGYGYGHAKLELLEILSDWLKPYRERRLELMNHPELIEAKLTQGAKEMNAIWEKKMVEVSEVVGL